MPHHCTCMAFEIASGHGPEGASVLVTCGQGAFVHRIQTCMYGSL
jgi:hypothetical protein